MNMRPPGLPKLRRMAIESFAELGFPSTHDEEWKYTNVAPLVSVPFAPARVKLTEEIRRRIERLPLADLGCSRLTFFNGRYVPELSNLREVPKGLKAGSLASAFKNHGALLERHFARYADARTHAFVALNTAFFEDGAFIEVPKGAVLQKPLHILQVSEGGGRTTVSHPRNLILVGSTGQATVIETFFSLDGRDDLHQHGHGNRRGRRRAAGLLQGAAGKRRGVSLRARAGAAGTLLDRDDPFDPARRRPDA